MEQNKQMVSVTPFVSLLSVKLYIDLYLINLENISICVTSKKVDTNYLG